MKKICKQTKFPNPRHSEKLTCFMVFYMTFDLFLFIRIIFQLDLIAAWYFKFFKIFLFGFETICIFIHDPWPMTFFYLFEPFFLIWIDWSRMFWNFCSWFWNNLWRKGLFCFFIYDPWPMTFFYLFEPFF